MAVLSPFSRLASSNPVLALVLISIIGMDCCEIVAFVVFALQHGEQKVLVALQIRLVATC